MGRFPVDGEATYAGRLRATKTHESDNASVAIAGTKGRTGVDISAADGAAVIAVQDGRVVAIGTSKRLGNFVQVRDAYGNTYTYGHLGSLSAMHVVPRTDTAATEQARERRHARPSPIPRRPRPRPPASAATARRTRRARPTRAATAAHAPKPVKERLFANPQRPQRLHAGGERQLTRRARADRRSQPVADGALGQYLAAPVRACAATRSRCCRCARARA